MMFPSISLTFVFVLITNITLTYSESIVIEVNGDCATSGERVAREHGYRVVRQIFNGFCEIEEDPSSANHARHRRAIERGIDPAHILVKHDQVQWAESQIPKIRRKREYAFNDPQWDKMWYLMRHSQVPSLPDLNVTGAWMLGYTGRGKVVTFLDDGLEYDHPDLQENYDQDASTDINGNDDDPTPRYEPTNENKHGTRCAGEVAAKINNNICGVGIAYHANVGGIRMLDGDVTDSVEARSLSFRPDHIDIYSASWGPDDNGLVVDGPGRLAKKAFENGALHGRGGKGSIFVWASGNGGRQHDSCACDGYITSIYTIAISATTEHGNKPWYLEECSATLASAYSSGQLNSGERDIYTTDLNHECTSHHTGTSAAAPLAAAIYALVLEANPTLTWRDVMHITVLGSRPHAIPANTNLVRNAAGFNVSSRFGFGLMDAGLMTWYASGWKNVPSMSTCESVTSNPKRIISPHSTQTFTLKLSECKDDYDPSHEVNYIEQVQAFVTLSTDRRGEIEIYLHSPSNTRSQLLPRRERDQSSKGFQDWPFLTVQLWGEIPHGQWKLEIVNTGGGSATLLSWKLLVHGTREYPISPHSARIQLPSEPDRSSCHVECKSDEPCGTTETSCTTCRHFKQPLENDKFRCVGICPEGTYANEEGKVCLPCHPQCRSCRNATEISCVSCKSDFFLIHDQMTCMESCPEKYYTDVHLRKCIRCKEDCASCDTSSHICTSCSDGYALKNTDCVKSLQDCQSGEYFDFIMNSCRECHSQCLTCSGSQIDQCKSCDKTSEYPYLQYHTCVSTCSPGFSRSKNSFQCLPCHESCLNCTSSSELSCTSCKLGYVFLPDIHRCEKNTGKPFYLDANTGETHTCHQSCAQCTGSKPTDCIACHPTNEVLLDDGHCVNKCPLGSYKSEKVTIEYRTNICLPCIIGCKRCLTKDQCQECDRSKGYQLSNSNCVPLCQPGTFSSNNHCESCPKSCATCVNSSSCSSCAQSLLLFNGQCVEQCPDSYYTVNQQCFPCHPICQTCKGKFHPSNEYHADCIQLGPSEDDCKSCSKGFQFDQNEKQCLSQCPNGNYFDSNENVCQLCSTNCLECFYPGSYCRQCSYPLSLDSSTHRCLSCCQTNLTTNNCCQCPSSWDGFCLHPLVISSNRLTDWLEYPLQKIRTKFHQLDSSRQTIVILISIFILISIILCLFIISFRQLFASRLSSQRSHGNVEYVMLQNVDENDAGGDEEEQEHESKFLPSTNGHFSNNHTKISMTHVQET